MENTKNNRSNILSFDIEEWFQVANFINYIPFSKWESCENRVEIGVDFILETLEKFNIKATFFLVGWVAQRHPEMVKKIDNGGHEIGTHSYLHKSITDQTPEAFAKDIEKSIKVISDIISKPIKGFRAPNYSLTPKTIWALEILKQNGIEYDSSIYPTNVNPAYGYPNAPRYPFKFKDGLYEFPMSTFLLGNKIMPFGSGGYFRLSPYFITHLIMKYFNNREKFHTINIHPWELDPDQRVLKGINWSVRFKHYTNLSINRKKFIRFVSDFRFCTFSEFISCHKFPEGKLKDGILDSNSIGN